MAVNVNGLEIEAVDLPSRWSYASRSLNPVLALSSMLGGSDFHGFRRLLPHSKYRLSSREGRALCQAAIFEESRICHVAILTWPLPSYTS